MNEPSLTPEQETEVAHVVDHGRIDGLELEVRYLWDAVAQLQAALLALNPHADLSIVMPSDPPPAPSSGRPELTEDEMRARIETIKKELGAT